MNSNTRFIGDELNWLSNRIVARLTEYFKHENSDLSTEALTPPSLVEDCAYSEFIKENDLDLHERLFLALSLVPHLKPQLFDCFFIKNSSTGMRFSEFGGVVSGEDGRMIPTFNTLLFIACGDDVEARIELTQRFSSHKLFSGHLFQRTKLTDSLDYTLVPSQELVEKLIYNRQFRPDFTNDFPAHRVTTTRVWEDLVLDSRTMEQLDQIRKWLTYGGILMEEWGMRGKLKEGYRALFHGPSGTGKTMSASLLGKLTGRDVYCVDLSMVVSKYIGETEKNLSRVFDMAEGKGWILFFDEADALFGKRTGLKDSHDRYANQEIAFLLQRVENYDGLVVLSTNLKSNLDEAFARRFQSVIRFKMPDSSQRLKLWKSTFSKKALLEESLDLEAIAQKYELSGGSILNVVQYCSLMALSRSSNVILREDVIEGIRQEFRKEGRIAD